MKKIKILLIILFLGFNAKANIEKDSLFKIINNIINQKILNFQINNKNSELNLIVVNQDDVNSYLKIKSFGSNFSRYSNNDINTIAQSLSSANSMSNNNVGGQKKFGLLYIIIDGLEYPINSNYVRTNSNIANSNANIDTKQLMLKERVKSISVGNVIHDDINKKILGIDNSDPNPINFNSYFIGELANAQYKVVVVHSTFSISTINGKNITPNNKGQRKFYSWKPSVFSRDINNTSKIANIVGEKFDALNIGLTPEAVMNSFLNISTAELNIANEKVNLKSNYNINSALYDLNKDKGFLKKLYDIIKNKASNSPTPDLGSLVTGNGDGGVFDYSGILGGNVNGQLGGALDQIKEAITQIGGNGKGKVIITDFTTDPNILRDIKNYPIKPDELVVRLHIEKDGTCQAQIDKGNNVGKSSVVNGTTIESTSTKAWNNLNAGLIPILSIDFPGGNPIAEILKFISACIGKLKIPEKYIDPDNQEGGNYVFDSKVIKWTNRMASYVGLNQTADLLLTPMPWYSSMKNYSAVGSHNPKWGPSDEAKPVGMALCLVGGCWNGIVETIQSVPDAFSIIFDAEKRQEVVDGFKKLYTKIQQDGLSNVFGKMLDQSFGGHGYHKCNTVGKTISFVLVTIFTAGVANGTKFANIGKAFQLIDKIDPFSLLLKGSSKVFKVASNTFGNLAQLAIPNWYYLIKSNVNMAEGFILEIKSELSAGAKKLKFKILKKSENAVNGFITSANATLNDLANLIRVLDNGLAPQVELVGGGRFTLKGIYDAPWGNDFKKDYVKNIKFLKDDAGDILYDSEKKYYLAEVEVKGDPTHSPAFENQKIQTIVEGDVLQGVGKAGLLTKFKDFANIKTWINSLDDIADASLLSKLDNLETSYFTKLDADLVHATYGSEIKALLKESPDDLVDVWKKLKDDPAFSWELQKTGGSRWEKWSQREFFKDITAKGKGFETNVCLATFKNRSSAKYLELKQKFQTDFGKNLDDYDMYSQVQLKYDGDNYFVADQLFVKRNALGKIDDMVVIENKLSSTTPLTTPQSNAFIKTSFTARSQNLPSQFGSGTNLTSGESLKFSGTIQWYKVHDGANGDVISGISKMQ